MRAGSITGAARILNISQPSVSRLVSDLERSVGFALFHRGGRGLVPTVEAHRLFEAVEAMFFGIDRLQDLADTIRTTAGGIVSLGVIPALSVAEVPTAVTTLYRSRPDVNIMVYVRNTPGIVDAVQMQTFDLGVVGRQPPYGDLEVLYLASFPYVCLMPEEHPLAGEAGAVDLAELAGRERFITFGGAFPDAMMGLESTLSLRLRECSRLSAANLPVAAALARESGALAIVDPFSAGTAAMLGGVVSRPIRQRLKYHVALVTRGCDTLSLEAKELADLVIERLDQVRRQMDSVSREGQ